MANAMRFRVVSRRIVPSERGEEMRLVQFVAATAPAFGERPFGALEARLTVEDAEPFTEGSIHWFPARLDQE